MVMPAAAVAPAMEHRRSCGPLFLEVEDIGDENDERPVTFLAAEKAEFSLVIFSASASRWTILEPPPALADVKAAIG